MVTVGYVRLADAEDMPSHHEELATILREHLNAVGHSVDDKTELGELVNICARRQGKKAKDSGLERGQTERKL